MSKDDIIRFRCETDLKSRFEAVAKLERRDPSDLARIVLEDYVAAKESAIQGKPVALAESPLVLPPPAPKTKTTIYKLKRHK